MELNPDVLIIEAEHHEELSADRAELIVTVQGSSLVTGRAVLTKAKEVARLVEELGRFGIAADDISLEDVQAEVSSGILGKSSSATYRLRVRCKNLDLLPEALGAVTAAKNARLDDIEWRYPDSHARRIEWLEAAIRRANSKAVAAAGALGARITGVHRLTERRLDVDDEPQLAPLGASPYPMRRRAEPVDLGFSLNHQKRAGVRVTIEYRVDGFAPPH
jgi:uncharacterized protein YggE